MSHNWLHDQWEDAVDFVTDDAVDFVEEALPYIAAGTAFVVTGGAGAPAILAALKTGVAVKGAQTLIESGKKAGEEAERANELAVKAQQQQEEILQAQETSLEAWRGVYGDTEQNLREFYNNLTPQRLAATGLAQHQKQLEAAQVEIDRSFTQRGIYAPAARASLKQQALLESAKTKAKIRSESELKAAEAKQGFLSLGLPEKRALQAGVLGAKGAAIEQTQYESDIARQRAEQLSQTSAEAWGSIIETGISLLPETPKTPKTVSTPGYDPLRPIAPSRQPIYYDDEIL